jgi:hypothetical protein
MFSLFLYKCQNPVHNFSTSYPMNKLLIYVLLLAATFVSVFWKKNILRKWKYYYLTPYVLSWANSTSTLHCLDCTTEKNSKARSFMKFHKMFVFHGEWILAPCPTPKLKYYILPVVREYLFSTLTTAACFKGTYLWSNRPTLGMSWWHVTIHSW